VFHAHVEPLYEAGGKLTGTIGVALDITPRKQAEEELREANSFLMSIFENIPIMIFVKDAATLRFERLNQAGEKLLGVRRDDVIGKSDHDLFPKDEADFFVQTDRLVLRNKQLADVAEESVRTGRGARILHTQKMPLLDPRGEPRHLLGISEDITDRKRLEDLLRQAQKMEAIGQLAGGVAHDFNNLLTVILGNLGLALSELPSNHPHRELLAAAEQAAHRGAELTRQLLGFSRRTLLHPEPVDLNASMDEAVRLLHRTIDPRITLEMRPAPGLWPVRADPGQMSQVLMNLCLNARDAMPDGGRLTLETANLTLDREAAGGHLEGRPGDFVRLRVSDTGRGIPVEARNHLFEPFFTTKERGKGTGLGLAMVFGIVQQHGGWIDWDSRIGEGTCFDVFLPRLSVASLGPAVPAPRAIRGGAETVLLVDDQEMIRRLGEQILHRYGYRVMTAADGAEAVRLFGQHHARIDLVILDMVMPQLAGPEAFRELRRIDPLIPVLISSANSPEAVAGLADCQGAAGFVTKPYQPFDLARGVRAALDASPKRPMPTGTT
jgi:PAS domain S-box-containing protein